MSDSADNGVAVERKGLRLNWPQLAGFIVAILFAGGAIARFEIHARHTGERQDIADKSIDRLNEKREETGRTLTGMESTLKGIDRRLDRIEQKLDSK